MIKKLLLIEFAHNETLRVTVEHENAVRLHHNIIDLGVSSLQYEDFLFGINVVRHYSILRDRVYRYRRWDDDLSEEVGITMLMKMLF